MVRTTRISKWGSSLAVRIPKAIAEEWGVKEGTSIELSRNDKGLLLRKRRKQLSDMIDGPKPKYNLDEMVGTMKNAQLHPEIDTGPLRGNEIW